MIPDWPAAFGTPPLHAVLKQSPEDFQVDEVLGFEPSGDGEHVFLQIQKRGMNTQDVAKHLSRSLGLHPRLISWSGLKDRQALTSQWFGVHLPGRADPNLEQINHPQLGVLQMLRHRKKLQRGSHQGNRFELTLRGCLGDIGATESRLTAIAESGVPNYFGDQRFGHGGGNLDAVRTWFAEDRPRIPRQRQSLLLSSARSWLFNRVLAARVADGSWNQPLAGECFMLDGSASVFIGTEQDWPSLLQRVQSGDLHCTGPLPGKLTRVLQPQGQVAALEHQVLVEEASLVSGLVAAGVDASRRSLRMPVHDLTWSWQDDALRLSFRLPRGCFATTLVREFCTLITPDRATGVM